MSRWHPINACFSIQQGMKTSCFNNKAAHNGLLLPVACQYCFHEVVLTDLYPGSIDK